MNAPIPDPSSRVAPRPPLPEPGPAGAVATDSLGQSLAGLRGELALHAERTSEQLCVIAEVVSRIEEKLTEGRPAEAPPAPQYESFESFEQFDPVERLQSQEHGPDSADWGEILLGHELAASPEIETERQSLLADARAGQQAALGLIGQLMLFRSLSADRISPLLKDIGEAYYRWDAESGDAASAFRDVLIRWLESACAAAGVPNSIELVHPGDRFDASRHNARERGAEVARVSGWVVLRDNGKVYTKANVAVQ